MVIKTYNLSVGEVERKESLSSLNSLSSIVGEFWPNERPVSNEVCAVLEDDSIACPPQYTMH